MWIFSILFLISLLVTIVGLIMLIPKKTREKGKKISIGFLIICLVSYTAARIGGNSNPNDEPGTITKAEYKQIKEGMSKDEVKNIIGDPYKEDTELKEWDYKGINGVSKDSTVMLFFKKDRLDSIVDDGLTKKIDTSKGSAIPADTNITNDDYASSVQSDIEDAIGSTVDWSLTKQVNTVKQVEVNDNLGKNDGSKLILLHLNAPVEGTNNAIKKSVNEDTLKIAKAIMKDTSSLDFKKDSIIYFWYLPLTDSYGKTKSSEAYKISLESNTLKKIDYKHLSDVDLPAIADQYNVLYKE